MDKQLEIRDILLPEDRSLYLAGPFFNDEQLRPLIRVEELCDELKIKCNSPRKFLVLKPKASWEERKAVFLDNLNKIQRSQIMLACLDNPWPPQVHVHCGKEVTMRQTPDIGTVWEMGYAHAIGRPVVCYTTDSAKMNVMLAQGCNGFLKNMGEVKEFLQGTTDNQHPSYPETWDFDFEVANQWLKEIY